MLEIFDFLPGEYLITDESSLRDFTDLGSSDTTGIWNRITKIYAIELHYPNNGGTSSFKSRHERAYSGGP